MSNSKLAFLKLLESETSIFLYNNPISNSQDVATVDGLLDLIHKIVTVELVKRDLTEEDLTQRVIDFIKSIPPNPVDPIYLQ